MYDDFVSGLFRDYGVHAYGKWRGAFWRLASLVDLRAERHPGAQAAAEQALAWLADPHRLARIHKRRIEGRVRRCASQDGLGLYACLRVGLSDDPRLHALAESLIATQWPDLLGSKRRPDGTWRTEGRWWRRPGSKGSNVEAVDSGIAAHDLLTERARDVLKAAGRS